MKSATRLSDILCGGHLRATYGFVCISELEKSLPYKGHRILYDYAFSVCLHMTVLIASVLSRLLGHASSHSLRGPSICIPLLGTQTSEHWKVRSYRQRSPTLKGPHVRTTAPAVWLFILCFHVPHLHLFPPEFGSRIFLHVAWSSSNIPDWPLLLICQGADGHGCLWAGGCQ